VKLPEKKPVENLSQQTPTVLYNAMINPIVGYGMRGAIWYQGESNRNEPQNYAKLMPGLIENWRSLWGIGEFPFYFVQIAPIRLRCHWSQLGLPSRSTVKSLNSDKKYRYGLHYGYWRKRLHPSSKQGSWLKTTGIAGAGPKRTD
jgi:hypothetical protein